MNIDFAPTLCLCGCGKDAPIATRSNTKFGHVKGMPMRYILGHVHKRWPVRSTEERFWSKVEKTDGCWLWKAAADHHEYGRFAIAMGAPKRAMLAHHVAYILVVGPIPDGQELLHDCDNPNCVRPSVGHVRAGTHAKNMADAAKRNRTAKGTAHGMHKFTEAQILEMRALSQSGVTGAEIARRFQTHSGHVSVILSRKLWAHI